MGEKKPLIIIGGATATGKTALSLELARVLETEIVSADSMQVYKYMDVGTAKPAKAELEAVRHYMIDEFPPDYECSAAGFKERAKAYISGIHEKGKIPIIAGGTGFYLNALIFDTDFTKTDTNKEYREYLYGVARKEGAYFLHKMLEKADPESAAAIHANNVKRAVRALEFLRQTGEPISTHNRREAQKESPYNYVFFALNMPRAEIYSRINERVDKMLESGLVREVEGLLARGYYKSLTSMQGLGYKEIIKFLEGEISLPEAAELIKRATRNFAKRQLTWLAHKSPGVVWKDAKIKVAEAAETALKDLGLS
ncbi:MAG: tRNA (adenosine(37)-N6)-dimethylallyltransferase MiaA [Clostridiales bacterium]|jgi:tRNA dimethylallyltransferase|nr:tRNA (adenosine(37)-N6)-dimethylallyltransferase MiaA [Clostridiales bacterium]